MLLERFRKRLRPHARSLAVVAGVAGGLYLAGTYLLDRLKDIQAKVTEERASRESLRRRFLQNQEDCTFTLLALLPTLSAQILEEMDVEDLTHQLQQLSKPKPEIAITSSSTVAMEDSIVSLASTESSSDVELLSSSSSSSSSAPPAPPAPASSTTTTTTSSGEEVEAEGEGEKTGEVGVGEAEGEPKEVGRTQSDVGASWSSEFQEMDKGKENLSESQQSVLSIASTVESSTVSSPPAAPLPPSAATLLAPPKTKMQLWNELKLLTFTRTLTALYTLTLLTLQTRIQLNLLGRHSYVRSVKELETTLGLGEGPQGEGEVSPEDEMVYLSFSWWLMNVGWREVAERVERAVKEVMGPVSLKKTLNQTEFEALLLEIRRKVEFDLGGDSIPRPHSFLPHLLPPTPSTLAHLLQQTHLNALPSSPTAPIRLLLSETSTYLSSPSFESCLSSSLAHAFGSLVDALGERRMLGGVTVDQQGGRFEEIVETKPKRLAEVLAEVAKFGRESLEDGGMLGGGNRVVDSLADLPELASFSAVVYSSYLGLDEGF
ncbi:Peroxin-3 [Mrakia frigida]|uniref:Pex3p n=1 Tax=Mrakia frigida TaxID=29902 RepID=UPI003FCC1185